MLHRNGQTIPSSVDVILMKSTGHRWHIIKRWFPNYQASECVDILICMTYQYGYRQDKTEGNLLFTDG